MRTTQIRTARPTDAPAIERLLVEGLGHEVAFEHLAKRIDHAAAAPASLFVLVADLDGAVVGVAATTVSLLLEYAHPQARLSAIVVDAAHRRHGIARSLLAAVVAEAERRGCFRLELTSAAHLTEAHAFWRHLGYEDWGLRFGRMLALGRDDPS
jgi:GNAT superfamily N-acetyltransferase